MKLTNQLNFNEAKLKSYVDHAVRIWTDGIDICESLVRVNSGWRRAFASVVLRLSDDRTIQVCLSHELIVQAVVMGSAAEGNPIDPASVDFYVNTGCGYDVVESPCAKAQATTDAPASASEQKGFPLPAVVRLDEKIVEEFLLSAVAKNTGKKVNSALLFYYPRATIASVNVQMTDTSTSTVKLDDGELKQMLAEEMNSCGYAVEAEGINFSKETTGWEKPVLAARVPVTRIPK